MSIQSTERRSLQRLTLPLWVAVVNIMTKGVVPLSVAIASIMPKDVKKRRMTAETKRDIVTDLEDIGSLGTEIHWRAEPLYFRQTARSDLFRAMFRKRKSVDNTRLIGKRRASPLKWRRSARPVDLPRSRVP